MCETNYENDINFWCTRKIIFSDNCIVLRNNIGCFRLLLTLALAGYHAASYCIQTWLLVLYLT